MEKPSEPQKLNFAITKVIRDHALCDWFNEYPWLTGSLGNLKARVWFLGEYPSRAAVAKVDNRAKAGGFEITANLQWSCLEDSAKLWREAVTEAGLKVGEPCDDSGWNCYITNIIKEPQIPSEFNTQSNIENQGRSRTLAICFAVGIVPGCSKSFGCHGPTSKQIT